ncbi:hypothetical protein Bbelb_036250 [Branchiostoma belcheri]|nr:hypothetical protein Bbelb_036250 [Branchiostoma belcheri]
MTTPSTREIKRISDLVDSQLQTSFEKMKMDFLDAVKRDIIDAIKTEVKVELDDLKMSLNAEMSDLKRTLVEKDKEIEKLNARLAAVENHANRNEQYSRKNCLLAFGIPPPPSTEGVMSENCAETFIEFSKNHLDIDMQPSDIDIAHRVGGSRDGVKPIIVKFSNYTKRSQVYSAKKNLKGKRNIMDKPFVIRENLTKRNLELYNAVKRLPQVGNVWTKDGKIYAKVIRDGGTSEIRRFDSDNDVHQFANTPPSQDAHTADEFINTFSDSVQVAKSSNPDAIVILGDFNAKHEQWWHRDLTSSEGSSYIFDSLEKARILNQYFVSQSTIDDSHASLPAFDYLTSSRLCHITTSPDEVLLFINNLDTGKAHAPFSRLLKTPSIPLFV